MLPKFAISDAIFRTSDEVQPLIRYACAAHPDIAMFHELGCSEEGRIIYGVTMGTGAKSISLVAGAHSDEPVGPETLRYFILKALENKKQFADLLAKFRFAIVPHVNPDGEAQNHAWIKDWPSIESYLKHAFRDLPGRDVEFGYPEMRVENRLVADFIRKHAPVALHLSLHGMGFSDGIFLLIEKHWIKKTGKLRSKFIKHIGSLGFPLHDHDRKGEKGFQYIGPGFTTTPEGHAMRAYFQSIGDHATARLFQDSSMEFVRKLGGDPLCLVTELPLFLINKIIENPQPGTPQAYLEFKSKVPDLKAGLLQNQPISNILDEFKIASLDLALQIRLQLFVLGLGLEVVS